MGMVTGTTADNKEVGERFGLSGFRGPQVRDTTSVIDHLSMVNSKATERVDLVVKSEWRTVDNS